ncbi:hypothetical protein MNBD_GAMMA13-1728 [hydrothermal vent metagenome]|uniref:MAPEG family protein n=1 Tax=hydrothermal vent metagenome TaxID=652676 RepID=A0A3B0Z5C7_9ZZZZ
MNTAYWCVLISIVMPYILGLLARFPGFTLEGNLRPRITAESLTGYQQRAYWAHLNALEAIPSFASAIIIANLLSVPQDTINSLALIFIGFRIAHALAYIANLGTLRTLMWAGGFVCIIALFVAAT